MTRKTNNLASQISTGWKFPIRVFPLGGKNDRTKFRPVEFWSRSIIFALAILIFISARAQQRQDSGKPDIAASIFDLPNPAAPNSPGATNAACAKSASDFSNRLARLEAMVEVLSNRLGRTNQQPTPYNSVEKRLTDLEKRITDMEHQMEQLNRRMQKAEQKK